MQKVSQCLSKYKCSDHNEDAIFVQTSFANNKNYKLCYKCVLSQNKNLMLIDDVEKQFQDSKNKIINEMKSKRDSNVYILKNVKANIHTFQISFLEKTKQIQLQIEEQIKKIINMNNETFDQVTMFNFEEIEKSLISNKINYGQIKKELQNQFQTLSTVMFLDSNQQLLEKIEMEEENYKKRISFEFTNFKIQNDLTSQINNLICDKHKSQLMMVDLSEQSNVPDRIACYYCISEYEAKYTSFERFKQLWMEIMSNFQEQFNQQQKHINMKIESSIALINNYKEKTIKLFDEHTCTLRQIKDEYNQKSVSNIQKYIKKDWIDLNKQDIIEIATILSQLTKAEIVKKEIQQEFDKKQIKYIDQLSHLNNQIQQMQNQYIIQIKNLQKNEEEHRAQKYEMQENLQQNQIANINKKSIYQDDVYQDNKQEQNITSMLLSPDSSILITGCQDGKIKVFELKNEQLKQIEILFEHKNQVDCLLFMKKSMEFISGSKDETIIFWQASKLYKEWKAYFNFKGNVGIVNCMSINNDENLLIAGCSKKIKLWQKQNQWKFKDTILEDKTDIKSICISDNQNIIISSSVDSKYIQIFLKNANQWQKTQKIITTQWGLNLCFINNTSFIFQPFNLDVLEVYDINQQNQNYEKSKEIQFDFGNQVNKVSHPQFIKSQEILHYKTGQNINIIRCQKNGSIKTETQIKLKDGRSISTISEDCKYLIIWNYDNKEFQIRKLKN